MDVCHIFIILQQVRNATVRHRPRGKSDATLTPPRRPRPQSPKPDVFAVQTANHHDVENALAALEGLGDGDYTLAAVAAVLGAKGSGR